MSTIMCTGVTKNGIVVDYIVKFVYNFVIKRRRLICRQSNPVQNLEITTMKFLLD
jgi:hypothetical protein